MKVLITGAKGQLGRLLVREFSRAEVIAADLPEVDITGPGAHDAITGCRPDVVVHAAAMTHVDGCALDPVRAHQVNALGTQNVARACREVGAHLIHMSTNEVFDGEGGRPYAEYDPTSPVNAYGQSKLAAEQLARGVGGSLAIVRLAWLYSPAPGNFPDKILTAAEKNGALRVVTDEVANPTYAPDLARAVRQLAELRAEGIFHMVNEGACSRWAFARGILEAVGRTDIPVAPITSSEFDRPSTPPAHTPLHNFLGAALGVRLRPWQEALADWAVSRAPNPQPENSPS